jgi:hypothetical protein
MKEESAFSMGADLLIRGSVPTQCAETPLRHVACFEDIRIIFKPKHLSDCMLLVLQQLVMRASDGGNRNVTRPK